MIDKHQFKSKYNGRYWERAYVGPVINKMANAEGEERQPWEILRDELPGLLDFSDLVPEGATYRMVQVKLRGLYVEQFLPTTRHSRERRFVIVPRWRSEDRDKYACGWAEEMFGEEPSIQVPVRCATTAEAPIAFIIDYTDRRFSNAESSVYRWYNNKLWKPSGIQDVELLVRNAVDNECLAGLIVSVTKLDQYLIVGDDEVWIETTEPIVHTGHEVDWGKNTRYGYRAEGEYREGYTNPVHWLWIVGMHDWKDKAGRDDWTDYYSLTQLDEALAAINASHADYNEARVGEPIEAICPFNVTVYRPEALTWKRGPREGELPQLDLKCPECGHDLVECSVGFSVESNRVLHHGAITTSRAYVNRNAHLVPFQDKALFHFLQCKECEYREFAQTLENKLGLDPVDDNHTYEHMNQGALTLLETLIAYFEAVHAEEYVEDLQAITDDWRGAIS